MFGSDRLRGLRSCASHGTQRSARLRQHVRGAVGEASTSPRASAAQNCCSSDTPASPEREYTASSGATAPVTAHAEHHQPSIVIDRSGPRRSHDTDRLVGGAAIPAHADAADSPRADDAPPAKPPKPAEPRPSSDAGPPRSAAAPRTTSSLVESPSRRAALRTTAAGASAVSVATLHAAPVVASAARAPQEPEASSAAEHT